MPYLTDRQRVELAFPCRLIHSVVFSAFDPLSDGSEREEGNDILKLLNEAAMQPIEDLDMQGRAKLARRIERLFHTILPPKKDHGSAGKMGCVAYYFLEALIADGILVLYEGSPMATAVDLFLPRLAELFAIKALDESAQKQARRMLEALKREGYYRG